MGCFTILGGRLAPQINLAIRGKLAISTEQVMQQMERNTGLGLPDYREFRAGASALGVIGGGPSITLASVKQKIMGFEGDLWAINGAYGWCRKTLGIDPVFISADPHPEVADWARGAKRALIESRAAKETVEALRDSETYIFDAGTAPGQIACGSSTVTAIPHIAVRVGYKSVTLFGCDSCFSPSVGTHAYHNERRGQLLLVEADGQQFITGLDFYQQAIELSGYIREVPAYIKEESGGLLRAMVKDQAHRILWLSEEVAKNLPVAEVLC